MHVRRIPRLSKYKERCDFLLDELRSSNRRRRGRVPAWKGAREKSGQKEWKEGQEKEGRKEKGKVENG